MGDIYTDKELEPLFGCVAAGYTVDEACAIVNLDKEKFDYTWHRDLELRCHVIDLSMQANYKVSNGLLPIPLRKDDFYARVNWAAFYRNEMKGTHFTFPDSHKIDL
jgi:hypothetical protein